ncbi:MAG: hypothetical protein COW30_05775 [Rhodospirillales bacterium CG15_BIG_FIL_POST_REV_8_21_14_020_66_15]|nr:MAG: hypothetical protein COW30_05775 [Rhodospirillales bacterium CG15_BIG_FIL_POST_REV_8_21_14_020_66_15]
MPAAPQTTGAPRDASLDALRRRIAALEHFSGAAGAMGRGPAAVPLGVPEIDRHLPWGGLPRGTLHEIAPAVPDGGEAAAAGFAAILLSRLARDDGRAVVWCRRPAWGFRPGLYGAGLRRLGLAPDRLVLAQAPDSRAVLWCMEECLRSRAVAAVLGEPDRADARARRRLQLAAEDTGVTAFLLMGGGAAATPGTAVTRWHVGAAPGGGPAWRVALVQCRGGGRPGDWTLEWRHDNDLDDGDGYGADGEPAGGFRMVSPLRDGPASRRAE